MSVPASYFEEMYGHASDPWGLATRWYERRKYACSLAALPEPVYRNAYEPGCSIGVLSAGLAQRCERLLCTDMMDTAVEQAARRMADLSHVEVHAQRVPEEWPGDRFDLIVVSELAYYFGPSDRELLWSRVLDTLEPDGTLLAVHWRQSVPGYACDGDRVHRELDAHPGLCALTRLSDPDFLLGVYRRSGGSAASVAQREGLR